MYHRPSLLRQIGLVICAIVLFFFTLNIISSLVWLIIRIALPLALLIWLIRELSNYRGNRSRF